MAFEQKITLSSQHEINYWRVIDADIDFFRKTAKFIFGGYKDYENRLKFEDSPAKTHTMNVNDSNVFDSAIPSYENALPRAITTDLLIDADDAPFKGAERLSNMAWNYPTSYKGLNISHFRIRRLRMNWNANFAKLTINAYKDETAFSFADPSSNTARAPEKLTSYVYSPAQFNRFFDASSYGGSSERVDPTTGETITVEDPLESEFGFSRSTVYNYAKQNDPFFENAVDNAK